MDGMKQKQEAPKIAHTEEQRSAIVQRYLEKLNLEEADLQDASNICVVGSGGNEFAAYVKAKYPGKFVMGVEPAERAYDLADTSSVNHAAAEIAVPEGFVFDLVVSLDAIPYLHGHAMRRRTEVSDDRMYDQSIHNELATNKSDQEIIADAVASLSRMIEITSDRGKVVLYPVHVAIPNVVPTSVADGDPDATVEDKILARVQEAQPNHYILLVEPQTERAAREMGHISNRFVCRAEIRKRG